MMGAGLGCWLLELSYSMELFPWTLLIKLKDWQVLGHIWLKQALLYPPSTEYGVDEESLSDERNFLRADVDLPPYISPA